MSTQVNHAHMTDDDIEDIKSGDTLLEKVLPPILNAHP